MARSASDDIARDLVLLVEADNRRVLSAAPPLRALRNDRPLGHHDHIVCVECGHVEEFYDPEIEFLPLTGDVGVGTPAPAAKLDIKDRIALQDANGRNYFKDSEKNDGKGLRVGAVWNQYGLYAETGRGALGGADGVTLQNGGLTINNTGVVSTSGDLSVGRFVSSKGHYQRDNQTETTYSLSPRYHVSLTGGAFDGSTRLIPQDVINELCGDSDGCEYRLGMTRWSDDTQTETASRSGLFYYSMSDGHWRSSEDQIGVDGNRITEHVKYIWETCYFTDAPYFQRTEQRDDARGMYLLVWHKGFSYKNRTCELTLID